MKAPKIKVKADTILMSGEEEMTINIKHCRVVETETQRKLIIASSAAVLEGVGPQDERIVVEHDDGTQETFIYAFTDIDSNGRIVFWRYVKFATSAQKWTTLEIIND